MKSIALQNVLEQRQQPSASITHSYNNRPLEISSESHNHNRQRCHLPLLSITRSYNNQQQKISSNHLRQ